MPPAAVTALSMCFNSHMLPTAHTTAHELNRFYDRENMIIQILNELRLFRHAEVIQTRVLQKWMVLNDKILWPCRLALAQWGPNDCFFQSGYDKTVSSQQSGPIEKSPISTLFR